MKRNNSELIYRRVNPGANLFTGTEQRDESSHVVSFNPTIVGAKHM